MKQHDGFIKNSDVNVLLAGGGHKPLSDFFIKNGGTSSQFLKADGSIDSNIYNPTNNFKTINGNSIIGTGNISISGGDNALTRIWDNKWSNGARTFDKAGLRIEQASDETSGISFNGDYINMWSPADSYCIRYWDEDNGGEIWNINSSGYFSGSVSWSNVSGRPFEGAQGNYPNWGFNPLGNTDQSWITGFAVYNSGLSSDWGCLRYYLSRNTPNGGGLSVCMDIDGSICTPGQIYSGTGFVSGSDRKLKYNIDYITDKKLLPIKKFNKISNGVQSYGFIAQELEDVGHHELVINGSESKAVDYNAALSLCIAQLSNIMFDKHQEIDSRINLLEKRILDLELENQDLRKRLNN